MGREDLADDGFLMGLFSTIDAFLELPLVEALGRLALADSVRGALLGTDGTLRPVLDLALAYERGHWNAVASLAVAMGLAEDVLTSRYAAAIEFGNAVSQVVAA
jgi:EAL and modified HD-GYP domain-containing signal transduction protein